MRVELLNGNNIQERVRIIATAGLLSRSKGDVFDLYASRDNYEKNLNIAKKIIGYGHETIIEHDYLVFGIKDVSPIIEQILIGQRLASFTIKSRREVDFSKVGYYTPDFSYLDNGIQIEDKYKKHMDYLFEEYSKMVDLGIPKEDARFVLPYCYHSNMVMGVDARTLEKLINYCLHGKMSVLPEVFELGTRLKEIVNDYVPYLIDKLDNVEDYKEDKLSFLNDKVTNNNYEILNKPRLIDVSYDESSDILNVENSIILSTLMNRYQISYEEAQNIILDLTDNEKKKILDVLCTSPEQRELEQVTFKYQIPISLANLTHLTRHRMQSLLIPDFIPMWNLNNHIVPPAIKSKCLDIYEDIYQKNLSVYNEFVNNQVDVKDLVYFYLSGNMVNVTTNINARALMWVSRMRCCNKSQWEIRKVANDMVSQARVHAPYFGKYLGATCDVYGICPEGKECCGKVYQLRNNIKGV